MASFNSLHLQEAIMETSGYFMRKILIVEDERLFAQLLRDVLSDDENMHVEVAENGREALGKISTTAFDLIITDIRMPEMSGVEFIQQVRARGLKVGFIVLTAHTLSEYIREFNEFGIVDFLSKDECDLDVFRDLVKEFFRRQDIDLLCSDPF